MERCPNGYILEKVIGNRQENLCFNGLIEIGELSGGLCFPLRLCDVQVMDIRPCGARRSTRLEFTVCVTVMDGRGCRAEGIARFEVESCIRGCCACGVNVRRGAEIRVISARFCPPCCFEACFEICLQTLESRCELVGGRDKCCTQCPQLPLYPPPPRPSAPHFHEHFSGF